MQKAMKTIITEKINMIENDYLGKDIVYIYSLW